MSDDTTATPEDAATEATASGAARPRRTTRRKAVAGDPATEAPGTEAPGTEAPGTDASDDDEGDDDSLDFVTFAIGDELFALPMERVHEIIRLPSVITLPLGPPSLKGLANLRGKVLPVVDLRRCCGFEEVEYTDATRVVVADCGVPLGFAVDRVASVLSVDRSQVDETDGLQHTLDAELLQAVIRAEEGMIEVLDIDHLAKVEYQLAATAGRAALAGESDVEEPDDASEMLELVSFVVDGQEYALPIDDVQEIVQPPERLMRIPNADRRVNGLLSLRGRLLPVIGLRRVFGLGEQAMDPTNRIIVVPLPADADGVQTTAGLLVDSVRKVLRIPLDLVSPLPEYLASGSRPSEVEQVCRLDDGTRLVSVLSVDRVFGGEGLKAAVAAAAQVDDDVAAAEADLAVADVDGDEEIVLMEDNQLVVFRLAGEEYGVDVDAVQEIIRVPEQLVSVPKAPDAVEGLVNLRGTVLPVVDLRRRLGLRQSEADERQRIVVLNLQGSRTGFIVDSVAEVMKLSEGEVDAAPELSEAQAEVITQVVNRTDRMLLILDVDSLVTGEVRALADSQLAAA